MAAPTDISSTFAKGLVVLKCFDGDSTHLTVPEIARRTGLDRAVTRRLVLTLVHLGYVAQEDRAFSLTPRILVLAGGFLQGRRFGKLIQPILAAYSAQAGLPFSLAMQDESQAVYVAHAGDQDEPRLGFTVGSRVPMDTTAIGRALLETDSAGELLETDGTFEPGIIGIACAVVRDGEIVAAIGTSAPRKLMQDPLRRAHVVPSLQNCAQALSELF